VTDELLKQVGWIDWGLPAFSAQQAISCYGTVKIFISDR